MTKTALLLCAAALAGMLLQPASAVAGPHPMLAARADQQDAVEERRERRREQVERRREQREQLRRENRSEARDSGGAERAARIARRQNGGGRVLSVHPDGDGYRVRLLKDGEVRSYLIKDR